MAQNCDILRDGRLWNQKIEDKRARDQSSLSWRMPTLDEWGSMSNRFKHSDSSWKILKDTESKNMIEHVWRFGGCNPNQISQPGITIDNQPLSLWGCNYCKFCGDAWADRISKEFLLAAPRSHNFQHSLEGSRRATFELKNIKKTK